MNQRPHILITLTYCNILIAFLVGIRTLAYCSVADGLSLPEGCEEQPCDLFKHETRLFLPGMWLSSRLLPLGVSASCQAWRSRWVDWRFLCWKNWKKLSHYVSPKSMRASHFSKNWKTVQNCYSGKTVSQHESLRGNLYTFNFSLPLVSKWENVVSPLPFSPARKHKYVAVSFENGIPLSYTQLWKATETEMTPGLSATSRKDWIDMV